MVAEVKYRDFDLSELNAQLMERNDWIGRRYCLIFAQTSMNELTCKCASSFDRRAVVSRRIILFFQLLGRIIKTHRGVFAATIIQRYLLPWRRRRDRKVYAVVLSTIIAIVSIPSIAIFRQDRVRSVHEFDI